MYIASSRELGRPNLTVLLCCVQPCRLTFAATPTPSPTPAGIDVSDVLSDAGSAATPGGGPAPAGTVTLTVSSNLASSTFLYVTVAAC